MACYSYGSYENMKDLCDDSKEHLVENALLDCAADVYLKIDLNKKSAFEAKVYKHRVLDRT